jgi:hypothetical protein
LPLTVTRRLILQKARHHGHARRHDDALTACKPTVSGTISLPSRGTFHLSLTVLVHYRSPELYLALRGGPRRFTRNFPGPVLLGDTARRPNTFSRTGLLPSAVGISITVPLSIGFVTPWKVCCPSERAPQPRCSIASRLYHYNGLGSFRFARRYSGSRCCFLFLGVLRCFNSPGSLHWAYFIQPRVTGHLPLPGFPIRRSTDRSLVGGSPWLIAATHVLHRHLAPRHPPLALCSLESSRCSCSLCSSQGAGRYNER